MKNKVNLQSSAIQGQGFGKCYCRPISMNNRRGRVYLANFDSMQDCKDFLAQNKQFIKSLFNAAVDYNCGK